MPTVVYYRRKRPISVYKRSRQPTSAMEAHRSTFHQAGVLGYLIRLTGIANSAKITMTDIRLTTSAVILMPVIIRFILFRKHFVRHVH